MKKILAKAIFVAAFPLITFCIVCAVILQEFRRAAYSIWLELRIEFGSLRDVWSNLDG